MKESGLFVKLQEEFSHYQSCNVTDSERIGAVREAARTLQVNAEFLSR